MSQIYSEAIQWQVSMGDKMLQNLRRASLFGAQAINLRLTAR